MACQVIQRTGPRRSALGAVEWVNSEVAESVVMLRPAKQARLNYILFQAGFITGEQLLNR